MVVVRVRHIHRGGVDDDGRRDSGGAVDLQPDAEGVRVVATPYGVRVAGTRQYSMVLRAVYFVLVGWWVSMFVAFAAWLVSLTLVGLPAGLWLMNRLPEVTTLRRN